LRPYTPQKCAGIRIEPPMSLPNSRNDKPADIAAHAPPDRSSFVYKARFFSRCLAWRQLDVLWRAGLLTTGPAG
jgi:hypothetical protein